ncbi:hypothetical protein [Aliikangiella coralliicola]|uniref:Uncharacterized protein n=1 Tax=Aliikangiella coralliicola TaxID=2592383 RepID=A0A545UB98_9GAMM|nr:hypothetical protein [Aliikangiella coralliicola]TQV86735.1 hypothetical protein FLL46_17750 [Aliikangiella coralliicola]
MGESVLITGHNNRIVIRYPESVADEVVGDMLAHMQRRENWSVAEYENTTAYQENEQLFIVNMGLVTGVGK